jgi:hypothetical protein
MNNKKESLITTASKAMQSHSPISPPSLSPESPVGTASTASARTSCFTDTSAVQIAVQQAFRDVMPGILSHIETSCKAAVAANFKASQLEAEAEIQPCDILATMSSTFPLSLDQQLCQPLQPPQKGKRSREAEEGPQRRLSKRTRKDEALEPEDSLGFCQEHNDQPKPGVCIGCSFASHLHWVQMFRSALNGRISVESLLFTGNGALAKARNVPKEVSNELLQSTKDKLDIKVFHFNESLKRMGAHYENLFGPVLEDLVEMSTRYYAYKDLNAGNLPAASL